jgi:hypothetical protein
MIRLIALPRFIPSVLLACFLFTLTYLGVAQDTSSTETLPTVADIVDPCGGTPCPSPTPEPPPAPCGPPNCGPPNPFADMALVISKHGTASYFVDQQYLMTVQVSELSRAMKRLVQQQTQACNQVISSGADSTWNTYWRLLEASQAEPIEPAGTTPSKPIDPVQPTEPVNPVNPVGPTPGCPYLLDVTVSRDADSPLSLQLPATEGECGDLPCPPKPTPTPKQPQCYPPTCGPVRDNFPNGSLIPIPAPNAPPIDLTETFFIYSGAVNIFIER